MESIGLRKRKPIPSSLKASTASASQSCFPDPSDFDCIVRTEVAAAIDESFARNTSFIKSRSDILRLLEDEAQKMFDSVDAAKERDEMSRKHNKRMEAREQVFRLIGMICLMCPVLVSFNAVMSLIPGNPVEVLEYASQEDNTYGAASRFCLMAVKVARRVSQANSRNGFIFFWGSLGAMALLLVLVRHTTVKHTTMNKEQRLQIESMKKLIREELERRRASL